MANIYTIGFNYRQRIAKDSPFWDRRFYAGLYHPTPGWNGDPDSRRFRFDKWVKRPAKAIALYYRLRSRLDREVK